MMRHYISRMQRSLYGEVRWYKFYPEAEISVDGREIRLPKNFDKDRLLYDTDSMCVSVSVIVGENGSGKSSILDMMVRMLNNAATAMIGEEPRYLDDQHVH